LGPAVAVDGGDGELEAELPRRAEDGVRRHAHRQLGAPILRELRCRKSDRLPGFLGTAEEPRDALYDVLDRRVADGLVVPPDGLQREALELRRGAGIRGGLAAPEADARPEGAGAVDGVVAVAGAAIRQLNLEEVEAQLGEGIDLDADRTARRDRDPPNRGRKEEQEREGEPADAEDTACVDQPLRTRPSPRHWRVQQQGTCHVPLCGFLRDILGKFGGYRERRKGAGTVLMQA